jgi:hypothetical protein
MSRFGAISVFLSVWMILAAGPLFAGATPASSEDGIGPKAVFLKVNYDFGEVFEGVDIKYDFSVENRGDAPLVIKNIRPD